MKNKIINIVIIIIFLGIIIFFYSRRNNTNTKITDITVPIKQNEQIIKINDSIQGIEQFTLVTDDKKVIFSLQDSLQRLLAENIKLKNIKSIVSFKETFSQNNIIGTLQDSFSSKLDELQAKLDELNSDRITLEDFNAYKSKLLASKISYKTITPYIYDVGTIDFYGNKITDTLEINSESNLTMGETRKNIFYKPKITALISNKNPYVKITDVKSVVYVPKNKWELSAGPSILINGRGVNAGVGINVKKGFISINVGYKIF